MIFPTSSIASFELTKAALCPAQVWVSAWFRPLSEGTGARLRLAAPLALEAHLKWSCHRQKPPNQDYLFVIFPSSSG